jgi:polyhydroxyalkanoate synthesis regulator phasin
MPKSKPRLPLAEVRAAIKRVRAEGERLVGRVQRDAKTLVSHSRAELLKDARQVRKDVQVRAEHALHMLEKRIVKQLHAATEERVAALEQRVARLEEKPGRDQAA